MRGLTARTENPGVGGSIPSLPTISSDSWRTRGPSSDPMVVSVRQRGSRLTQAERSVLNFGPGGPASRLSLSLRLRSRGRWLFRSQRGGRHIPLEVRGHVGDRNQPGKVLIRNLHVEGVLDLIN